MSDGFYSHKQKIQMCDRCDEPTGNCEDDTIRIGSAILCHACYEVTRCESLKKQKHLQNVQHLHK